MTINISFIFRSLLFFLFIFVSIVFFYIGYLQISNISINKENKIFDKTKIINFEIKDEVVDNENKNIKSSEKIINEEEIVIIVKKNDTFSKLIDSFFSNKNIKNKVIQLINNQFDLKKLNINQKIFIYINNDIKDNKVTKIVIPINFKTDLVLYKKNLEDYYVKIEQLPIKTEFKSVQFEIIKSII